MANRKCPSCKCNIGKFDTTCPKCGELIFEDPVEVSEETIKENEEQSNGDSRVALINKKKLSKIKDNFLEKCKNFGKRALELLKKFYRFTRLYKLRPYITYVNVLAVVTLIATICKIGTGIKIVSFRDSKSELRNVKSDTTYYEIKAKLDKKNKEGKRSLDLQRGLLILTYEDENIGGVNATLQYEMKPGDDIVETTVIKFKHNDIDVIRMKQYLDVNYGIGKKLEDGTISYEGKDNSYTYTNGTCATVEIVKIKPLS